MIQVEIPNNISEYKPKLIMGLDGKQVCCVLLTAVVIFLDFKFLKPFIGDFLSLAIAAGVAFVAALFGWISFYGMPFEKYLKSVLFQAVLAPKYRKFKTNHSMVVPCDKNYIPVSDEELSEEVLNCVNYVREKQGIVVDSQPTTKHKKPKYKKSKLAMR